MAFWSNSGNEKKGESTIGTAPINENQKQAAVPGASLSTAVVANVSSEPHVATTPSVSHEADHDEAVTNRFGGKLRSVLGSGTVIQGKLSFDTPVRIDGKLTGEVYSSKALIVGKTASVDAQVEVESLIVLGTIRGKITATERIEILPGGIVEADISTPSLVIDNGHFNGNCVMPSPAAKATSTVFTANAAQQKPKNTTVITAEQGGKKPNGERTQTSAH